MSATNTAQNPEPFPRVHLSPRDLTVLSHSIGAARFLRRPIDRRALQVYTDTATGDAITPDDAAHAVEWAVNFQATLHPPM